MSSLSSSPSRSNSSLHLKDLPLLNAPSEDTQTFLVFYQNPLTFNLPRSSSILSALANIHQGMIHQSARGSWGNIASSNLYSIRHLTADSTFETFEKWQEKKIADLCPDDPRLPVICTISSSVDQDQVAPSANTSHASEIMYLPDGKQSRHSPSSDSESRLKSMEALVSTFLEKIEAHEQEVKGLRSENQLLQDRIKTLENVQYYMLVEDREAMDQIKARHLLVVVQQHLAHTLGVAKYKFGAAAKWDECLGRDAEPNKRIKTAREKLKPFAEKDPVLKRFIDSRGFLLAVNDLKDIKSKGNLAAHPLPVKKEAFEAIMVGSQELADLLEFAVEITKDSVC